MAAINDGTCDGSSPAPTSPSEERVMRAREEIERDIRIAIWNAGKWQGKPDEVAQSLIRKAMAEPTMIRALNAFSDEGSGLGDGQITDDEAFIWRWIERAIYDRDVPAKDALGVLAHYPGAPWNRVRWDVDHKPYAAAFYADHPKAK